MNSPDALNAVKHFHETFKHPVLDKPEIPDENRQNLRISLLAEELDELQSAIMAGDLTEVADALCDLQYVLSGAILEFGMGDAFHDLFNEVQRSNMSKACKSEEEARETVAYYTEQKDTPCYFEKSGDVYLVYREADRKTLKSIYYSPAKLDVIIEKYKSFVDS